MFELSCVSDKIWNMTEFVDFLTKNQNSEIELMMFPEAVCLETLGVYKILDSFNFSKVTISTYNPFETHHKYHIKFLYNFWFTQKQNVGAALHTWNKNKKFFCLYHRPTAGRLGIASYLNHCHQQDSLIHFSASTDEDNLIQFELDKLLRFDIASVKTAGDLVQSLPMLLSSPDRYTHWQGYFYDDPLTDLYKDILIDVVVESHVSGTTFFPTEKTLRPMWLKKPFIVFGSKDYLLYLRQMGFRTFADFWDEEYDGYETRERYVRILALLDQLSKKSYSELQSMYLDLQYTLQHNYDLLQNQTYTTDLTYID